MSAAMSRKRPRGERGVACANAEADRRDAGARATSAKRAVEGRGGSDRESLAPTAGREIRQFVSRPGKPPLRTVNHRAGQYVVGAIHTNTIEGFWSLIKRDMVGTFHKVSKKYRSCPVGWCSSGSVGAALAGTSRAGQAATAGSPTMGSSRN
ncbi:MAG: transposase, partial [Roseiarcus sp.]